MIRTLVVDDSEIIRCRLKPMLVKEGCEIAAEADNGVDALALYQQHKPDLVTLDISMPGQDGIVTLKQIISDCAEAKVIIVSAIEKKTLIMEALSAGAKAFIAKPFQPEHISEKINRLFPELHQGT